MEWIELTSEEQLQQIKQKQGYSIIFKHSTRCSISLFAKKRVEQDWAELPPNTEVYYLDLLNYRPISSAIADIFQVYHQSPQLLLIKNGECIYETSHGEINVTDTVEQMTL
ncbi:bacillithiol system redox-active protein YtxJ [Solitalea sp. MAHUQ-68]|uniref:Bacillithiol system redox-active protein YtxJ n=1 Tax=Solitalea agri TaxID=2953739 RepID=A0A9X2F0V0_9SPHI|nr:bacillithiol system redox-active protein YtxJ [Solitalea agri]MCO4292050.1 bacillithiol system redox-active protein YtxJ [Solitalea agri]